MDRNTLLLFAGIGALLALASLIGFVLKRRSGGESPVIDNLNARINAWWVMVVVIGVAFWLGTGAVILLFYAVSFYALREFLTLTPTRRSDWRMKSASRESMKGLMVRRSARRMPSSW